MCYKSAPWGEHPTAGCTQGFQQGRKLFSTRWKTKIEHSGLSFFKELAWILESGRINQWRFQLRKPIWNKRQCKNTELSRGPHKVHLHLVCMLHARESNSSTCQLLARANEAPAIASSGWGRQDSAQSSGRGALAIKEKAFLLWLPLIEASFLALFKKPLFKPTPLVVGPSSQRGGRVGFRDSHRRVTGRVRGFLLCNCISFQVSPYPDQDPTDAGTLTE